MLGGSWEIVAVALVHFRWYCSLLDDIFGALDGVLLVRILDETVSEGNDGTLHTMPSLPPSAYKINYCERGSAGIVLSYLIELHQQASARLHTNMIVHKKVIIYY